MGAWYHLAMSVLEAHVKNGRLQLDEPTNLPEGTVVRLAVVIEEEEDLDELEALMDPEERVQLEASITRGMADARAGRGVDMEAFLDELKSAP